MLPLEAGAPGSHDCISLEFPVFRAGRICFPSLVPWLFMFPLKALGSQDSQVLLVRLPVSLDHLLLVTPFTIGLSSRCPVPREDFSSVDVHVNWVLALEC